MNRAVGERAFLSTVARRVSIAVVLGAVVPWVADCGSSDSGANVTRAGTCGTDCDGCCNGTSCVKYAKQTGSSCGKDGATCKSCKDGTTCSEGVCGTSSSGACDVKSCPDGCCSEGDCSPLSKAACGKPGKPCGECDEGDKCSSSGSCVADSKPDCAGKCAGESDTAGGTCADTDCAGCCTTTSPPKCVEGLDESACGSGGVECKECEPCTNGDCSAVCKPRCDDVCVGEVTGPVPDGCEGDATCPDVKCPEGCCGAFSKCQSESDESNSACGAPGTHCEDCTASGKVCKNHECVASTEKCALQNGSHGVSMCKGSNTDGSWYEDRCKDGTLVQYQCATDGSEKCMPKSTKCPNMLCNAASGQGSPVHYHTCEPCLRTLEFGEASHCSDASGKTYTDSCGGTTNNKLTTYNCANGVCTAKVTTCSTSCKNGYQCKS